MLHSAVHYFMHIRLPESAIHAVIKAIFEDSACGTVYRIKGTLPSDHGKWLSVNAEKKRITLDETGIGQSVLIVIGENLDKNAIDARLQAENTDPDYVSI